MMRNNTVGNGFPEADFHHMQHALRLARRGLGLVAPNPSVGCVIVSNGRIVGRGVTARGGRPHAESIALKQAGENARAATIYVTLEPCCHHGKTPPCSEAIIAAGIARAVIACEDPNPEMQGRSIKQLQQAGIEVQTGVCEAEAREINAGFFSLQQRKVPLVSLKIATSLDGKITTCDANNQWLTGIQAREFGHLLRANHDAILSGIGTVLADNSQLTCRLPGLEDCSPIRIILDSKLRLPDDSALLNDIKNVPLWVITTEKSLQGKQADNLRSKGVKLLSCSENDHGLSLAEMLQTLGQRGITRLLVEGGAEITSAFLRSSLADRLYWFRAPLVVGSAGKCIMDKTVIAKADEMPHFKQVGSRPLGVDQLEIYDLNREN